MSAFVLLHARIARTGAEWLEVIRVYEPPFLALHAVAREPRPAWAR